MTKVVRWTPMNPVSLMNEFDRLFERPLARTASSWNIALDVAADGAASEEELARVATEVRKFCPLSKLFRAAGTEITETWRRREP